MFDVAVIGMGIVGASALRELARYDMSIVGIEAATDVAAGATRANSGIVHGGYDAHEGTAKAYFNVKGNALYPKWSEELDFPFIKNGSLVICKREEDIPALADLLERGIRNGVEGLEIISGDRVMDMEPALAVKPAAALWVPSGGITCPYEFCYACTENAVNNGAQLMLESPVTDIRRDGDSFVITAGGKEVRARAIFNAAGLFSDEINNMISSKKYDIRPRKGEYILMDKDVYAFERTIFELPTVMGKGILISPTADGNTYIGPTSVDIDDKTDTSTTREGQQYLKDTVKANWNMPLGHAITGFSGLRAHLPKENDFVIGESEDVPMLFNAIGVESPGLTSAPAIAEHISKVIAERLGAAQKENFNPVRKRIERFYEATPERRRELFRENADYGSVVCRCEKITKAEIKEAIRRGARTLDGVKRRCRAGMGKCQGGFCGPTVLKMLAEELGISEEKVLKDGKGSNVLVGDIK